MQRRVGKRMVRGGGGRGGRHVPAQVLAVAAMLATGGQLPPCSSDTRAGASSDQQPPASTVEPQEAAPSAAPCPAFEIILASAPSLPSLNHLLICPSCLPDPTSLAALGHCTTLRSLQISGASMPLGSKLQIASDVWLALAALPHLSTLNLTHVELARPSFQKCTADVLAQALAAAQEAQQEAGSSGSHMGPGMNSGSFMGSDASTTSYHDKPFFPALQHLSLAGVPGTALLAILPALAWSKSKSVPLPRQGPEPAPLLTLSIYEVTPDTKPSLLHYVAAFPGLQHLKLWGCPSSWHAAVSKAWSHSSLLKDLQVLDIRCAVGSSCPVAASPAAPAHGAGTAAMQHSPLAAGALAAQPWTPGQLGTKDWDEGAPVGALAASAAPDAQWEAPQVPEDGCTMRGGVAAGSAAMDWLGDFCNEQVGVDEGERGDLGGAAEGAADMAWCTGAAADAAKNAAAAAMAGAGRSTLRRPSHAARMFEDAAVTDEQAVLDLADILGSKATGTGARPASGGHAPCMDLTGTRGPLAAGAGESDQADQTDQAGAEAAPDQAAAVAVAVAVASAGTAEDRDQDIAVSSKARQRCDQAGGWVPASKPRTPHTSPTARGHKGSRDRSSGLEPAGDVGAGQSEKKEEEGGESEQGLRGQRQGGYEGDDVGASCGAMGSELTFAGGVAAGCLGAEQHGAGAAAGDPLTGLPAAATGAESAVTSEDDGCEPTVPCSFGGAHGFGSSSLQSLASLPELVPPGSDHGCGAGAKQQLAYADEAAKYSYTAADEVAVKAGGMQAPNDSAFDAAMSAISSQLAAVKKPGLGLSVLPETGGWGRQQHYPSFSRNEYPERPADLAAMSGLFGDPAIGMDDGRSHILTPWAKKQYNPDDYQDPDSPTKCINPQFSWPALTTSTTYRPHTAFTKVPDSWTRPLATRVSAQLQPAAGWGPALLQVLNESSDAGKCLRSVTLHRAPGIKAAVMIKLAGLPRMRQLDVRCVAAVALPCFCS